MKSYNDYLYESVSTYNEYKQMPKEDLDDSIDSFKHLTYHHVRGMLDNKNLSSVDGIKRLSARSSDIDDKGLGLLTLHAMNDKDQYHRQQHAYHLVNSGKLSDIQLKHVAKSALYNEHNKMFDNHLAKKINSVSKNKDDVSSYIEGLRNQ